MAHVNLHRAGRFVRLARARRVTVAMMMDSNGQFNNYGYRSGLPDAAFGSIAQPFDYWAGGIIGPTFAPSLDRIWASSTTGGKISPNDGLGDLQFGSGYAINYAGGSALGINVGTFSCSNADEPASGDTAGIRSVATSEQPSWFDWGSLALTFHYSYAEFAAAGDGDESLQFRVSYPGSTGGNVSIRVGTAHSTTGGSDVYRSGSIVCTTGEVPDDGASADRIELDINSAVGTNVWGSLCVEIPERTTGFQFTSFFQEGGATTEDLADDLSTAQSEVVGHSIETVMRVQGESEPMMLVAYHLGGNDFTTGGGRDWADVRSDVDDTFAEIRTKWAAEGGAPENLVFLVISYFARTDPNFSYRSEFEAYAAQSDDVALYDTVVEFDGAAMVAGAYYDGGGSEAAHMSVEGYHDLSVRLFEVLENAYESAGSGVSSAAGKVKALEL